MFQLSRYLSKVKNLNNTFYKWSKVEVLKRNEGEIKKLISLKVKF